MVELRDWLDHFNGQIWLETWRLAQFDALLDGHRLSFRPYFQRLSEYLALLWCQLEDARSNSQLEEANAEQQDLLMSLGSIFFGCEATRDDLTHHIQLIKTPIDDVFLKSCPCKQNGYSML